MSHCRMWAKAYCPALSMAPLSQALLPAGWVPHENPPTSQCTSAYKHPPTPPKCWSPYFHTSLPPPKLSNSHLIHLLLAHLPCHPQKPLMPSLMPAMCPICLPFSPTSFIVNRSFLKTNASVMQSVSKMKSITNKVSSSMPGMKMPPPLSSKCSRQHSHGLSLSWPPRSSPSSDFLMLPTAEAFKCMRPHHLELGCISMVDTP